MPEVEQHYVADGIIQCAFSSDGLRECEIEILDRLRALRPAGVLLAPPALESHLTEIELFCQDLQTVLFDSRLDGLDEAFEGSDDVSVV